jgi:prepilin-type N-terminal cleavage/methylation domain-containing protein
MNKKGFTLVELLAVIVIIALIMTMIMPSVSKVRSSNKTRIYSEYETMMTEYARISELNTQNTIDLSDLDELDKVKNECTGYVTINHSNTPATYQAYINCGEEYQTSGYNSSMDLSYNGFCPGCVFPYIDRDFTTSLSGFSHTSLSSLYTTWNTSGNTPSILNKLNYTRNYKSLNINRNTDGFIGLKLNGSGEIVQAFACRYATNGTTPYCIEGAVNNAKFSSNKTKLQSFYNTSSYPCTTSTSSITCYSGPASGNVYVAAATNTGYVMTGNNGENRCYVEQNGRIYCDDSGGIDF